MQEFRNLKVWQRSFNLSLNVYEVTRSWPKVEQFGLTSQLRRSIISVPANIAEGAAKDSKKDFHRFLSISLGSLNESMTFIMLAKELSYIDQSDFERLFSEIVEIKKMISALMTKIKKNL